MSSSGEVVLSHSGQEYKVLLHDSLVKEFSVTDAFYLGQSEAPDALAGSVLCFQVAFLFHLSVAAKQLLYSDTRAV